MIDLDDCMSHSFTCRIMAQLPLSLVNRFQGVTNDSNFVKLFSLVFKHVSDYSPPNDVGSEPVLFCRQWHWRLSTFLHFVPSSNSRHNGRIFLQFWTSRILDQSPSSVCSFINPLPTKLYTTGLKIPLLHHGFHKPTPIQRPTGETTVDCKNYTKHWNTLCKIVNV
jgi:hypothetical protein